MQQTHCTCDVRHAAGPSPSPPVAVTYISLCSVLICVSAGNPRVEAEGPPPGKWGEPGTRQPRTVPRGRGPGHRGGRGSESPEPPPRSHHASHGKHEPRDHMTIDTSNMVTPQCQTAGTDTLGARPTHHRARPQGSWPWETVHLEVSGRKIQERPPWG